MNFIFEQHRTKKVRKGTPDDLRRMQAQVTR